MNEGNHVLTHIRAETTRRSARTAGTALALLLLAACGTSTGPNGDSAEKPSKASSAPEKPLRVGQPSRETVELDSKGKTGKFTITPQRVVVGKAADLDELDDPKYKGWAPAWVYVNAKLVGGDAPMTGPMVMSDVGVLIEGDLPVQQLLILGLDLSSKPADCEDDDPDAPWQKGEDHTRCAPFLVPEGKTVTNVTYSRGYYQPPLKWAVK
ncbi:hypothetical protein OG883_32780 [Streptomyces sp. NBC_01142]|uniref:hypothetical protein n=1 Tax=Streptomyces sp. NBC_01142 TaxID=2975865 RepID=UPI00224CF179|nr:hypothetical protein [Streptomyces sp. NBC_01142]MCX4824550.1 hypothetical protein [Streptomyces sp. NBC_01142]